MGRTAAKEPSYSVTRQMTLTPEDFERLRHLAQLWGCTHTAVVRRLLREAAGREQPEVTDG